MVDYKRYTVDGAPDDERPSGSVPKTAERHHKKKIYIRSALGPAASPQRDVEVVAQESRERYMPSTPKVDQRCRLVG